MIAALIANSRHRKEWTWHTLQQTLLSKREHGKICVLGLAYKKDTNSIKNSPALALLAHLKSLDVTVYDPIVPSSAAGEHARGAPTALDAAKGSDAVLIMTPWDEFADLSPVAVAAAMNGNLLIDPYGVVDGAAASQAGLDHYRLGRPPLRAQREARLAQC